MMPALVIDHDPHRPEGANSPVFRVRQRGRLPTHWLKDRRPAEALAMVGCLYNLCAAAQTAAAASAMGLAVPAAQHTDIQCEVLREHALVMLRDWPGAMGHPAAGNELQGLASMGLADLEEFEHRLLAQRANRVLADLSAWWNASPSLPAQVLRQTADWPPEAGRMEAVNDPSFVRRVASDPSLAPLIARHGWSLHVRMLARVVEVARLIEGLRGVRDDAAGGDGTSRSGTCSASSARAWFGRSRPGDGWAEAARGRLWHQVDCRDGRVMAYRIHTPTDAMLDTPLADDHDNDDGGCQPGFLARLLSSAYGSGDSGARQRVAIALSCADPCLPVVWQTTDMTWPASQQAGGGVNAAGEWGGQHA